MFNNSIDLSKFIGIEKLTPDTIDYLLNKSTPKHINDNLDFKKLAVTEEYRMNQLINAQRLQQEKNTFDDYEILKAENECVQIMSLLRKDVN